MFWVYIQDVNEVSLIIYFLVLGFISTPLIRSFYIDKGNLKAALQEKTEAQLKLHSLQSQMNPHFIFNSLNSIQTSILEDPDLAYDLVYKFSVLLRKAMENSVKESISLKEEITFLNEYIKIERNRFESEFQFKTDFKGIDTGNCQIPPMLIQPIIENAIKHGIPKLGKEGLITLSGTVKDELLYISVEDNGIGRANSTNNKAYKEQTSVGTSNIQERISLLNSRNELPKRKNKNYKFELDIIDKKLPQTGTVVIIKIPIKGERRK